MRFERSTAAALRATDLPTRGRLEPWASPERQLVDYYSEAGPDFAAWSRDFNMHFGFYRRGIGLLRREAMLEQMNREVYDRLQLPRADGARILDLGCGLGATARSIARRSCASVTGVTLVPWQVEEARRLTDAAGLGRRVSFLQADYRALPVPDASVDGVYAIESACYASGWSKADLLREVSRVLKPGGRLVVADGFCKPGARMNALVQRCYDTMCRFWRVETCAEIAAFEHAAAAAGLGQIRSEEISWHVAPSMMFIPLVAARFLWREGLVRRRLTRARWENALAPLLGMLVGAARSAFGYYFVTGRKPEALPSV